MNRSRWISLGFVVLFIAVTIVVPAWKERAGQILHKSVDGIYAAFVLLCMGLVCIWWADMAPHVAHDASDDDPRATSNERRPMKSIGWLFLILSIAIPAADLIR